MSLLEKASFHYAPLLKWKQGEYSALGSLDEQIKDSILPIFMMPPAGSFDHEAGKVLTPAEHIGRFATALENNWAGRTAFVDAFEIDNEAYVSACGGVHPLSALLARSRLSKGKSYCSPVTGTNRSDAYQTSVRRFVKENSAAAVCFRIDLDETEQPNLEVKLKDLLKQVKVTAENVVLLLNVTDYDLSEADRFAEFISDHINGFPLLHDWHSLIISLSALPRDLKLKKHQTKFFARDDWRVFVNLFNKYNDGQLLRMPIYSDFGIDAATFSPSVPVRPSAQLRYTTPDMVVAVKGENTKTAGYEAIYPVAAEVASSSFFTGESFSSGGRSIAGLAKRELSTGSAATWKKHCFNHHFTVVDAQICELLNISRKTEAALEQQLELI